MRSTFTLLSLLVLILGPVAQEPLVLHGEPVPSSTASKSHPLEVELADPTLAATEVKRHQLKYLINCALPDSMVLFSVQGGERITFPGHLGLAPEWMKHPMTLPQERWVSACMLALTNYFGKHVDVSLHANPKLVPFLEQTKGETRTFTIFGVVSLATSSVPIQLPTYAPGHERRSKRKTRCSATVSAPTRLVKPLSMASR
jgi:hypothetical protein